MLDRLYAVLAVAAMVLCHAVFPAPRIGCAGVCAYAIGGGAAVMAMWLASVNLAIATQALFPC